MQMRHHMDFRFKIIILLGGISIFLFVGCVSYQMVKSVEGSPVISPGTTLVIGKTTLYDVLFRFGAPNQVIEMEGRNLILYERILYRQNALTIGIPVMGEIGGPNFDFSARGGLTRYDTLALFFTPDHILCDMVCERGSHRPYLKSLFSDKEK